MAVGLQDSDTTWRLSTHAWVEWRPVGRPQGKHWGRGPTVEIQAAADVLDKVTVLKLRSRWSQTVISRSSWQVLLIHAIWGRGDRGKESRPCWLQNLGTDQISGWWYQWDFIQEYKKNVTVFTVFYVFFRHEVININLKNKPEWFFKKNPLGLVPVLETSLGQLICESAITCEYLDEAYPGKKLWPSDPYEKACQKMVFESFSKVRVFEISAPI